MLTRRNPNTDGFLLRDVSLTLQGGDRLALLGASGSGKTLLLRSLAFLDPLDGGDLLWNGSPITDVPTFRRMVTYLHQRSPLFEGTVEENLRLPYELHVHQNQRFERDHIVEMLQRLHRDESFLNKAHRDLSGGEAQITALLRAVQLNPHVLLLDEPTAALDSTTTRAVENLLLDWVRTKETERAFVWVSHEQAQSERMSTRSVRIEAGQICPEES